MAYFFGRGRGQDGGVKVCTSVLGLIFTFIVLIIFQFYEASETHVKIKIVKTGR